MKRYKLLKDLPFAKAGDIFKGELEYGTTVLFPEDYENYKHKLSSDEFWDFDEWFEEIKEPKKYYYILDIWGVYNEKYEVESLLKNRKEIGNYFETREEAEKYLEYLKAKEVIKEDTKGFKPDWSDKKSRKYYGYWDFERGFKNYFEGGKPSWDSLQTTKESNIYFESWEDIEESFEKHPEEWKTYLLYEQ